MDANAPAHSDRAATTKAAKLTTRRTITGVLALPLFMVIFLPALFIGLLHSPAPHGMHVAVIGSQATAGTTVSQLKGVAGSSFDVKRVDDVATAERQLRHLDIRAAYNPATGDLYTASAGSLQAQAAAGALFQNIATASKTTITTHDVVPVSTADPLGMSALYIGIGAIAGGFLTAVILSLIPVSVPTRIVAGIAMPLIISAIEVLYGWVVYNIFPGSGLGAGLAIFGMSLVSCAVTMGLMTLAGPAMLLASVLILLFLGITASGVPVSLDMASGFYRGMFQVIPTARALSELKTVIYFHGHGILWDVLTQAFWFVGGVGATVLGLSRRSRRQAQQTAPSLLENIERAEDEALAGI
jgi:hypothetical protein